MLPRLVVAERLYSAISSANSTLTSAWGNLSCLTFFFQHNIGEAHLISTDMRLFVARDPQMIRHVSCEAIASASCVLTTSDTHAFVMYQPAQVGCHRVADELNGVSKHNSVTHGERTGGPRGSRRAAAAGRRRSLLHRSVVVAPQAPAATQTVTTQSRADIPTRSRTLPV